MIVHKTPYIDEQGKEHNDKIETYSDKGLKILQVETGKVFDTAIDVSPLKYTYQETTEVIEDAST